MAKSLQEWLQEGQELYDAAIAEYRRLEEQSQEIQQKLAAKRSEVNQISRMIGKPSIDESPHTHGGASAVANGVDVIDPNSPNSAPYTRNTIARALTGQPIRR